MAADAPLDFDAGRLAGVAGLATGAGGLAAAWPWTSLGEGAGTLAFAGAGAGAAVFAAGFAGAGFAAIGEGLFVALGCAFEGGLPALARAGAT